jgi:acetolactate synthase I/II/III large subunit
MPKTRSIPTANTASHSTAHYLLQGLNEIDVEYLFCNFGTDHAPLIEELARFEADGLRAPKVVLCPHENIAIHMAGGYAQMTGRGQAVLVHVDAGTANAALGMHNLFRNRIPVLLIAGSAPFTSFGELEGTRDTYVHFIQQPFDQGSLVRPYTKWEYTLPSGVISKEILRRAHSIMHSEPAGPVYLMLPREILTQPWDEQAVRSFSAEQFGPLRSGGADPQVIDQLVSRLLAAKNPILITGYAGRDAAASAAIESLSTAAGIRVIDFLTFTNIGRSFPHFGGFQADDLVNVDIGLLVDVDVPWIPVATRDDPTTFWAQIDVDVLKSGSPMWSFPANLRIQGKSSRILTQLTDAIKKSATPDFHAAARKRVEKLTAEQKERLQRIAALAADKGRVGEINPHYVCAEIGRAIEADDIVVNEAVTRQSIPNMQISRPKGHDDQQRRRRARSFGRHSARRQACVARSMRRADRRRRQLLFQQSDGDVCALQAVCAANFYGSTRQFRLGCRERGNPARVSGGSSENQEFVPSDPAGRHGLLKSRRGCGRYGERLVDPADVPAPIARAIFSNGALLA